MKTLTDKYFAGLTSQEEEAQLLRLLREEKNPSREQRLLMNMLSVPSPQADAEWLEEDASDEYDHLMAHRRNRLHIEWRWTGVAAAACIAIGFLIAIPHREAPPTYAVANIYGEETTDEALVLSMMEHTMQSVLACSTTDNMEGQLTDILNP